MGFLSLPDAWWGSSLVPPRLRERVHRRGGLAGSCSVPSRPFFVPCGLLVVPIRLVKLVRLVILPVVKGAVPPASLRGGLWPHRVGWLFALLSSVLSSATHWAQNCAQWLLGAFLALLDPRLPASPLRERWLKIALTFHLAHRRNFAPIPPPNGRNFAPVELHGCNHAVLLFTFAFLRFSALSRRRISQPPPALEGAGRVKCGTLYLSCLLCIIPDLC